jgi:adenine-specific DNA-methyltransferase
MTDFTSKKNTKNNFKMILELVSSRYIFISYSTDGILSKDDIIELLTNTKFCNIKVYEQEYKKFKSNNNKTDNNELKELLFAAEKNH